jgi:transmembrane sensor
MDQDLFEKFYRGECTEAERAQVTQWLQDPANEETARQWMKAHWEKLDTSAAPEPDVAAIWEALEQRVSFEEQAEIPKSNAKTFLGWINRNSFRIAASVVLLLVSGFFGYRYFSGRETQIVYQTDYGQLMTVNLPDSSVVVLNSHSKLRFQSGWNSSRIREVWLDGEGFFTVKHQPNEQKFLVHTADGLQVEVVGTQFSVFRHEKRTRVVLNNGKIKLRIENNFLTNPQHFDVRPGELVEFDNENSLLLKRQVNPEVYSSWKDRELIFDDTPLSEVATRLEATYGSRVILDPQLKEKRLTGRMEISHLDILLEALASTFDLKITQQGDTIYIKPND